VSRRKLVDLALLAVLGPLWLACLTGHLWLVFGDGVRWVPVYVTPAPTDEASPTVQGFWVDSRPMEGSVEPGDRLLSVGERSLAGAGRLDFLGAVYAARDESGSAPARVERDGRVMEVRVPLRDPIVPWRTLPLVIGFGLTGMVALWRGGGRRATRLYGLGALAYGFHWSILLGAGDWRMHVGLWTFGVGGALFMPLWLATAQVFPTSTAVRSPAWRAVPWLFALFGPAATSAWIGWPWPGPLGFRMTLVVNLLFLATFVGLMIRSYVRGDAGDRRQLRWVLYGVAVGIAPVVGAAALGAVRPDLWWLYEPALLAPALIPVCVLFSIFRFHFLDIDRVISATAVYTLLTALLLVGLLTVVPAAAERASEVLGADLTTARLGIAIALAVPFVLLEPRLRPRIESVFLRERRALERAIAELRGEIVALDDPGAVWQTLGDRLTDVLELQRCTIYARDGEAFTPVFARGPGRPPGFDARGMFAGLLGEQYDPVDDAQWRRWVRRGLLRDADRAVVESLDARVLMPLHRGEELEAVVCLGEKGSGDVYTPTDLALLDGLLDRTAVELLRFDEDSLRRAQQDLHERLRSYVPAAVVGELTAGALPTPSEREVSVLFCDIRGYTAFSADRSADEVFRAVNLYTAEVSSLVRQFGGSVVEFHGDGLMAVFGAPRDLPRKEQAAMEAACRIVERVQSIDFASELGGDDPVRLSVAVGVATGPAFVGDIQAVDRRIWAALGSTTNLAARLQALSREVNADIVVDRVTRERADDDASDFELRRAVEIRGFAEPVDVCFRPRLRTAA
jgi:class 3 adenylate cyclase